MSTWWHTIAAFSAAPDVARHLGGGEAAWVWARDGERVLWANRAGGAVLGCRRFADVAALRWTAAHPLRREIESVVRLVSQAGTAARLRLSGTPVAAPLLCRCRPVRHAEGRGVLIVAAGAGPPPSAESIAAFFSDGDCAARVTGADGRLLAGAVYPDMQATAVVVPFQLDGRMLTLSIASSRRASAPSPARTSSEAATPETSEPPVAVERAGRAAAALPTAKRNATVVPLAARAEADNRPAKPTADDDAPTRVATMEPRRPEAAAAAELAPEAERELARPIVAGRVARELSSEPVRFLWQTDDADRILFVSPGLAQVVGRNAEIVGERWQDASERLRLDPSARIARVVAQRETWSGQTAWWPVEGSGVRVPAELTALPIYGSDQSFQGYRGFGVLKPAEALMPAAFDDRFGAEEGGGARLSEPAPPYEEAPANVVPIRADLERHLDDAGLSTQERNAFEEIAAALRERVEAFDETARESERYWQAVAPPGEERADTADPPALPEEPMAPPGAIVEVLAAESSGGTGEPVRSSQEARQTSAPADSPTPTAAQQQVATAPARMASAVEESSFKPERHAESGAARRARDMSAILDMAADGVLMLDGDARIVTANAGVEALFGLDAEEMEGTRFADHLTEAGQTAVSAYLAELREAKSETPPIANREIEARAGPDVLTLLVTLGRLSGEGGGTCVVLRDITHWKRTESDLTAARRAAEAASAQKSEFLARVSHEIRTPLSAIIGFAEVIIDERFGPLGNERYRDYLRDIRMSGEHVVSLVNDLLDIAKIETGRLDLSFAAVSLDTLARECISLMQPQAGRAHVLLRSSLSREVPPVVADQRTMRQVILNLLSNAVKFTGPGGQIIVSASNAESGAVQLRIRDTGEGMTEQELQRALEPFRQLETASLAGRSGNGLGLPLTRALVEANRATLLIRSAPGEGTAATVTFPPARVAAE